MNQQKSTRSSQQSESILDQLIDRLMPMKITTAEKEIFKQGLKVISLIALALIMISCLIVAFLWLRIPQL